MNSPESPQTELGESREQFVATGPQMCPLIIRRSVATSSEVERGLSPSGLR